MKDKEMFTKSMTGLGELYRIELTETLIGMYWDALSAFTDAQCKVMFSSAIKKYKFFPKPAELIQDMEPPKEYMAQQQAGYLVAMLQGVGYRNPEGWDKEPTTRRLLESQFRGIGERALESDIKWIEKDFIQAYKDISEYVDNDETLRIVAPEDVKRLARGIG
jgi:hypothetical protein